MTIVGYTPLDNIKPTALQAVCRKLGNMSPYLYYYIKNLPTKERVEAVKMIKKIQNMDMEEMQKEIGKIAVELHNKLANKIEELHKDPKFSGMSRYEIAKSFVGSEEAKNAIVEELAKFAEQYKVIIKLIKPLIESYLHPGRVAEYLRAGTPLWYYLVISKPGGFEWIATITREVRKKLELATEEEEYELNRQCFEKALEEFGKQG